MRIAIVSHFPWTTQLLAALVAAKPTNQVVWFARNGQEAVNNCTQDIPDLILMDLVMPVMDGVAATRAIMQVTPCAILLLTTAIDAYPQMALEAKKGGAIDVLNMPGEQDLNSRLLLNKIDVIERLVTQKNDVFQHSQRNKHIKATSLPEIEPAQQREPASTPASPIITTVPKYLVAIGASTGGPGAVLSVLQQLTANFPAPVIVVQHVEDEFVPGLTTWFDKQIPLTVKMAQEEDCPQIGQILIAGGSRHLVLSRRQTLHYLDQTDMLYHPSIDMFFASLVEYWSGKVIGILLTGIGWDGAKGLKQLRVAGNTTFAQNEKSSIVYGMPRAAVEMGAAEYVLAPDQIGAKLQRLLVNQ